MKGILKPFLLLFGFVFTIYLARQSNMSFSRAVRLLAESKPSEELCVGVDIYKPFTNSQMDKADKFQDSIKALRDDNKLKDVIESGSFDNFGSDYVVPLIPFAVPWIVFFAITLFCLGGMCINLCCLNRCCGKRTWACCSRPQTSDRVGIYVFFAGLFLVCTVGVSIAGITFAPGVSNNMEMTLCSFINTVEDLRYGKPEDQWMGTQKAVDAMTNLLLQFDNTVNNLDSISGNFGTLDQKLNDALTANNQLLTNNQNQKATRANPQNSGEQYVPTYIQNLGTVTKAIQTEMETKRDAVESASEPINTAIDTLQKESNTIFDGIKDGRKLAVTTNKQVNNILNSIDDYGSTAKSALKALSRGLTGVYIANIVLAVFAIISIVMVGVFKAPFFNRFLHLSWMIIGILALLSWVLSVISLPASIVSLEVCEVMKTSLQDETFFKTAVYSINNNSTQTSDALSVCVFGDGNILGQFGVTNQMEYFDTIYVNLDKVSAVVDIDATSPPVSVVIPAQQALVTQFYEGTIPDATVTAEDLARLNFQVTKDSNGCTPIDDTWALNSVNCSSNMGNKFTNSDSDTFNLPNPTCLGFNEWYGTTSHQVGNRYTLSQFPATCQTVGGQTGMLYAQTFVTNFGTNRDQVKKIFSNVQTDLTNVQTKHDDFAVALFDVVQDFKAVKTVMENVEGSLVNEQTGLLPNTDCRFIKDDLVNLTDTICIGLVVSVYEACIVVIISSFMTFFASISVFCLAKRFVGKLKRDKFIHP